MEVMKGRERVPAVRDQTLLPGGGKLGEFWKKCKSEKRCERTPYDRLLTNPLLKADYHPPPMVMVA